MYLSNEQLQIKTKRTVIKFNSHDVSSPSTRHALTHPPSPSLTLHQLACCRRPFNPMPTLMLMAVELVTLFSKAEVKIKWDSNSWCLLLHFCLSSFNRQPVANLRRAEPINVLQENTLIRILDDLSLTPPFAFFI